MPVKPPAVAPPTRAFGKSAAIDRPSRKSRNNDGLTFLDMVRDSIDGIIEPFDQAAVRVALAKEHPGQLEKRSAGTLSVTLLSLVDKGELKRERTGEGNSVQYRTGPKPKAPPAAAAGDYESRKAGLGISVPRDPGVAED